MGETKREDDDDHDDHMGITVAKTQTKKKRDRPHLCAVLYEQQPNRQQVGEGGDCSGFAVIDIIMIYASLAQLQV